jgi:hypothetical protein
MAQPPRRCPCPKLAGRLRNRRNMTLGQPHPTAYTLRLGLSRAAITRLQQLGWAGQGRAGRGRLSICPTLPWLRRKLPWATRLSRIQGWPRRARREPRASRLAPEAREAPRTPRRRPRRWPAPRRATTAPRTEGWKGGPARHGLARPSPAAETGEDNIAQSMTAPGAGRRLPAGCCWVMLRRWRSLPASLGQGQRRGCCANRRYGAPQLTTTYLRKIRSLAFRTHFGQSLLVTMGSQAHNPSYLLAPKQSQAPKPAPVLLMISIN